MKRSPSANEAVSIDQTMQEFRHQPVDGSGQHAPQPNLGALKPVGFQAFDGRLCEVCNQPLSIHEQAIGNTCSQVSCKNQSLRTALQVESQRLASLHADALACRERVASTQGIASPEEYGLGILPSNDRPLTNTPAKKIRTFRDRLLQKISQAAESRAGHAGGQLATDSVEQPTEEGRTPDTELDAAQLSVLGHGCATCRGDCCPQGGDHAFIYAETIAGYMELQPKQRPRDILQDYMSRLPAKTYQGSCVYHTHGGCALPREMRSHICNGFLCKGLNQILHQLRECGESTMFVVATAGSQITRAAIIDQSQRTLYDTAGQEFSDASQIDSRQSPKGELPPPAKRPS